MQTLPVKVPARGFTLIELMVVILLIGLALGVGLTLDFSNSPQRLERQTQQVANIAALLAQEAVLDGAVLGLDFFATTQEGAAITGMRWLRQEKDGWVPADIGELGESAEMLFSGDIDVHLEVEGTVLSAEEKQSLDLVAGDSSSTFSPELLFLPSRELTPFVLALSGDGKVVSKVSGDIMGRVRVNEDAPTPP